MPLHYRCPEYRGRVDLIREKDHELMAFSLVKLTKGQTYEGYSGPYEIALVILKGAACVIVEGKKFEGLERTDVFSGRAAAVYIPRDTSFKLEAEKAYLEAALCQVKADQRHEPFIVRPEEVEVSQRGSDLCQREIHNIIVTNGQGRVDKIIVGEALTLPGNWSSFPPHKHDRYVPLTENELVEVYHFRFSPREAFGVQILYTEDGRREEAHVVRDGDTVLIPYGYHPIAVPPGVRLYHLWFLAGKHGREVMAQTDPIFQKLCGR